jgi:enamine deaminase RidA (YjgF/YER057c/UK114 family)
MSEYDQPPFPAADSDRLQIWRMLVERDIDAYLARNWGMVADDFIAEAFYGLDARGAHDPARWRLAFSSLSDYRDEWLRQAEATFRTADPARARSALFAATNLTDIDVQGDLALARKKFHGALPHRDGSSSGLKWQTLYVCRRHAGRWKIASFVGYLPNDVENDTRAFHPAATQQHKTAGPYTPVVGVAAGARLFVISGQAPLDLEGRVVGSTIAAQSRATLDNCRIQLEAAGCTLADVFKATVYLTDLANWQAFNEVYREYMQPPYPARTAVQTGLLPGFLVEIEMWAVKR